MVEVRIHGRGGQGNVVAAYLLATAAFEVGYHCQAFPSFGAERRGAPVASFVRIAKKPVLSRAQVQYPNFLIVQDAGLLHGEDILSGLREGGAVLINSPESSESLCGDLKVPAVAFSASALAVEHVGRNVPNVALLSAFLVLTELLPLKALEKALAERFGGKILDNNLTLVQAAARAVPRGAWKEHIPDDATA